MGLMSGEKGVVRESERGMGLPTAIGTLERHFNRVWVVLLRGSGLAASGLALAAAGVGGRKRGTGLIGAGSVLETPEHAAKEAQSAARVGVGKLQAA